MTNAAARPPASVPQVTQPSPTPISVLVAVEQRPTGALARVEVFSATGRAIYFLDLAGVEAVRAMLDKAIPPLRSGLTIPDGPLPLR